jgi:hypothetical protein
MSVKSLIENLTEVRGEALGMLDTIGSVRGERYKKMVQSLVVSQQIGDIATIIGSLTPEEEHGKVAACMDALSTCVCQIITNTYELSGLSKEELDEIINEAESITSTVHGLIRNAVKADREGKAFGSRDAH